jgi:hypothetical protein
MCPVSRHYAKQGNGGQSTAGGPGRSGLGDNWPARRWTGPLNAGGTERREPTREQGFALVQRKLSFRGSSHPRIVKTIQGKFLVGVEDPVEFDAREGSREDATAIIAVDLERNAEKLAEAPIVGVLLPLVVRTKRRYPARQMI